MSSRHSSPVRNRKCTKEGADYFREQCSKNMESSGKKFNKLIEKIDDHLNNNQANSAVSLVDQLHQVYSEYQRSYLRHKELCNSNSLEGGEIPDELHAAFKDVRERVRLAVHELIRKKITEIEEHIVRLDVPCADGAVLELDGLFSDFMSLEPQSVPWQSGDEANEAQMGGQPSDVVQEKVFTHAVDTAVFAIKEKLSDVKSSTLPKSNTLSKNIEHDRQRTRYDSPTNTALLQSYDRSQLQRSHSPLLDPLHALPPRPRSSERSHTRSGRSRSKLPAAGVQLSHRSGSVHSKSQRSRSSRSGSSRSRSSSNGSSTLSTRERAIEEKAKAEALKVEAKFLVESQRKENERRLLEMETERLEVQKEIEMAEARARVYDVHTDTESHHNGIAEAEGKARQYDVHIETQSNRSDQSGKSELINEIMDEYKSKISDRPNASIRYENPQHKLPQYEPTPEYEHPVKNRPSEKPLNDGSLEIQMSHLSDLCDFLKTQSAPNVDMDYFSGNPLDYQYFMSLFEELVEKKIKDPFGKLARLIKYTRGEAKDLIQHCSQMPQPDGYLLAKDLLEKEYGDPHKVTSAYMKELNSWKTIRAGNVDDFKKFYRFLLKCNTNRKGDIYLRLLDNPETLRNLQSKLPSRLQDRWTRKAVQHRETNRNELDFSHFLEFVRIECKVLDDPIYSNQSSNPANLEHNNNNNNKFSGNRNSNREKDHSAFASHIVETHTVCLYCTEKHDIDCCKKFLQLTLKEKKAYLYRQKICFYCYGPFSADEHGFNKCWNKRTCTTCNETHPTAMHNDDKKVDHQASRATHTQEDDSEKTIGMPILPVKVYHRDNPEKFSVVYAMLDNCSSGVFILQDCIDELGVETALVPVQVKTVIGVNKCDMNKVQPGLMVEGLGDCSTPIAIPKAYCKDDLAIDYNEIVTVEGLKEWDYLSNVTGEFHRYGNDIPIAMIIGSDVPRAVEQIESIPSQHNGPFAFRTQLGWCVAGPCNIRESDVIKCNRIRVKDISTNSVAEHQFVVKDECRDLSIAAKLQEMYSNDFNETASEKKAMSVEDQKFIHIMETGGKLINNHHQLPLPLRNDPPNLPNNKPMAVKRIHSVKRRMLRDNDYHTNYIKFMNSLISQGHARKVDKDKKVPEGMLWYVSHHGVYHPKTKKFRVVMACNAEYQGRSLNAELIPGPDSTNLLLGVLLRFRLNNIPFMGDIEQMFYQINVPEEQRSLLRFLWWPEGELNSDLEEFEMCVHLFGAVSSPSVAGYALRKTAADNAEKYGEAAAKAVCRNTYVDDLCKSQDTVKEAVNMITNISAMCAAGGFNLTKFVSSNREVLNSIPIEKRAKGLQVCDLSAMGLPVERALGVVWNVESDTLGFRIQFSNKALSRRVILSDVSSIYDPDGRGCAFVLPGKKILQEITGQKKDWDETVSEEHATRWNRWKADIQCLESLNLPRCYTPPEFGKPVRQSLHCFADGSTIGYGNASYLRSTNASGDHHVSLVTGKSRVAPLKSVTIPRLELTAATISVKVGALVKEELDTLDMDITYWTDSTIVLGYIANETKRFRTYERNRVNTIHRYSDKGAWRHVPSEANPADLASRGLSPSCKEKIRMWFDGPSFLWKNEVEWPENKVTPYDEEDEDSSAISTFKTLIVEQNPDYEILTTLEAKYSSWYKLVRVVAFLKRCIQVLKASKLTNASSHVNDLKSPLTVSDIQSAESQVIRLTQAKYLPLEVRQLSKKDTTISTNASLKLTSTIRKLDPYIDGEGLIRVGGRLKNCLTEPNTKHPIVIPKKSTAASLLIRRAHEAVAHCGRCSTLNKLRDQGFWVVGAHTSVKSLIYKCRTCRELRGKLGEQKMADLPQERVTPSPPFTYCGADMFGPFVVKEGRKEVKRYGCIFTCMSCRAVHIEVTSKLDADTFIQALRRFIARRGQVRSIRTDNGTNFIGAQNELKKALCEMDHSKIREFATSKGCDWIVWERNPPEASHMGGVWERQIRSIRTILSALMKEHSTILNDESLRTFMAETEAIINSRPLTVDTTDPENPVPLSPIQLLTFKNNVVFPPPGKFDKPDIYSRKHWRRVQYLANEFWSRWKTEYLSSLQTRQKWTAESRNFMVGDVVLVKDSNIFTKRNGWPMALVTEVFPSDDGLVRQVMLRVAYKQSDKTRTLNRPITKLILLVGADEHSESCLDGNSDSTNTPTTPATTTSTTTDNNINNCMEGL